MENQVRSLEELSYKERIAAAVDIYLGTVHLINARDYDRAHHSLRNAAYILRESFPDRRKGEEYNPN